MYITEKYYSKNANEIKEIWKPIDETNGEYEVSNKGNIKSLDRYVNSNGDNKRFGKGKILKFTIVNYYKTFIVKGIAYSVHKIVALYFIPNPNNLPQINHIDGNKANNDISNLEWCTAGENIKHALSTGLRKSGYGHTQSKEVIQFSLKGLVIAKFGSIGEAGRKTLLCTTGIYDNCVNNIYSSNGYFWKYTTDTSLIWIDTNIIEIPNKSIHKLSKSIVQLDKSNNIIKEFDSITLASKELKLSTGNISNVCNPNKVNKTCGGFKFKYK